MKMIRNIFTIFLILFNIDQQQKSMVQSLEIIFGGDVSFYGPIYYNVRVNKCSYRGMLDKMRPIFKKADHVILNLETTIGDQKQLEKFKNRNKLITFISEPKSLTALTSNGVDIVSLSNNHLLDYGAKGTNTTQVHLKKKGIKFFGLTNGKKAYQFQKPLILEKNGIKVCILSYCYKKEECLKLRGAEDVGPAIFGENFAIKEINKIRQKYPRISIVLSLHLGIEYRALPGKQSEHLELIKKMSSRVEAIVMTHAHVTTSHSYYNNTLITGHLGNFVFPMHMTNLSKFKHSNGALEEIRQYQKEWLTQVRYFDNESAKGKLVKLVFDRFGLVKDATKYMYTKMKIDKKDCIYIEPVKNKWNVICSKHDDSCSGTSNCNYIECKKKKPKFVDENLNRVKR